jgi:hypothetical protein
MKNIRTWQSFWFKKSKLRHVKATNLLFFVFHGKKNFLVISYLLAARDVGIEKCFCYFFQKEFLAVHLRAPVWKGKKKYNLNTPSYSYLFLIENQCKRKNNGAVRTFWDGLKGTPQWKSPVSGPFIYMFSPTQRTTSEFSYCEEPHVEVPNSYYFINKLFE